MRLIVYGEDAGPEPGPFGPGVEAELVLPSSFGRTKRKRSGADFVYFDAAAVPPARLAELSAKMEGGAPWGVLDPYGAVEDPAALLRSGASDYLGPALLRRGAAVTGERVREAASFAARRAASAGARKACDDGGAGRDAAFPGWGKLVEGETYRFLFCFASIADQGRVQARIGERRMDALRAAFRDHLDGWARERGGIVWIHDAASNLLLFPIPPADGGAGEPLLGAFRMVLDQILLGYETFRMEVPLGFRFAFHSGEAPWKRPGATGSVVSEHVNFIYHLGARGAPRSALVVSEDAGPEPAFLADLFEDAGAFEGRRLRALRPGFFGIP